MAQIASVFVTVGTAVVPFGPAVISVVMTIKKLVNDEEITDEAIVDLEAQLVSLQVRVCYNAYTEFCLKKSPFPSPAPKSNLSSLVYVYNHRYLPLEYCRGNDTPQSADREHGKFSTACDPLGRNQSQHRGTLQSLLREPPDFLGWV